MNPVTVNKRHLTYRSYLIRLWYADNAGHPVWRASLQEPGSETQTYFESLADLCAYRFIIFRGDNYDTFTLTNQTLQPAGGE